MTTRKSKAKASDPAAPEPLGVEVKKSETDQLALARKLSGISARHGLVNWQANRPLVERFKIEDGPNFFDYAVVVKEHTDTAAAGDTESTSRMLMAQAVSLDSIFTEYARVALVNMIDHPDGSDRLMRLALKAQANSRANLEALARMHQPREQTVRHVHVNDGGQAVITDQFHNHAGGHQNAETVEQPHAARTAGSGPAMLSHDAQGNGVPIPGREGEPAMQNARRQG